ncbi:MAG: di-heme oxidoredictase family protein [Tumebacillaceae bacterium]
MYPTLIECATGAPHYPQKLDTKKYADGENGSYIPNIQLTVQGEMGGMMALDPSKPLPADVQNMYDQLEVFLKYDGQIPIPKSSYRNADGTMTTAEQNGERLFQANGCATFHAGPAYTDSNKAVGGDGKLTTGNTAYLHDVGTANAQDKGSAGDARDPKNVRTPQQFDTPTLLGVYARAPYFHDGSAATLEDVFKHSGVHQDRTKSMSDKELQDLVEFLKELQ